MASRAKDQATSSVVLRIIKIDSTRCDERALMMRLQLKMAHTCIRLHCKMAHTNADDAPLELSELRNRLDADTYAWLEKYEVSNDCMKDEAALAKRLFSSKHR